MDTVQLMVFEVLMLRENKELLPYGGSYYLSTGNNYPNEGIMIVLFVIPAWNQLGWVEEAKEDWIRGTNILSLFLWSVQNIWHR